MRNIHPSSPTNRHCLFVCLSAPPSLAGWMLGWMDGWALEDFNQWDRHMAAAAQQPPFVVVASSSVTPSKRPRH